MQMIVYAAPPQSLQPAATTAIPSERLPIATSSRSLQPVAGTALPAAMAIPHADTKGGPQEEVPLSNAVLSASLQELQAAMDAKPAGPPQPGISTSVDMESGEPHHAISTKAPDSMPGLQPAGASASGHLQQVQPDHGPGMATGVGTPEVTHALLHADGTGPSRSDPALPSLPRRSPTTPIGSGSSSARGLGRSVWGSVGEAVDGLVPGSNPALQPQSNRPTQPPGFDMASQRPLLGSSRSRPPSPAVATHTNLRPPPGFARPQSQAGSRPASPYLGVPPSSRLEPYAGGSYLAPPASGLPLASQLIPASSQFMNGNAGASSMFGPGLLAGTLNTEGNNPGTGVGANNNQLTAGLYGLGGSPWEDRLGTAKKQDASASVLADPAVKHASLKGSGDFPGGLWSTGLTGEAMGTAHEAHISRPPSPQAPQMVPGIGSGNAMLPQGVYPLIACTTVSSSWCNGVIAAGVASDLKPPRCPSARDT